MLAPPLSFIRKGIPWLKDLSIWYISWITQVYILQT